MGVNILSRQVINVNDSTFKKLQKLRARYGNQAGGNMCWPDFMATLLQRYDAMQEALWESSSMLSGYANTHTARAEKKALIEKLKNLAGES
jgi:predicted glycoside hydrolase/deacetylase ChbG (UPF0249 family)